jgi:DNA-binding GntR family transcriptional regulator
VNRAENTAREDEKPAAAAGDGVSMARSRSSGLAELERATKPVVRRQQRASAAKREPGYGRLQQLLREEILDGRIPAGSRLKVSDIIARYGTSTNPAREALQGLEGEGLVIITPNRGARVRLINEDLVRNIFDIRALLEPYILRSFAEFATGDDIAALVAIQSECQRAVEAGDYATFHAQNNRFHDYMTDRHFNVEAVRIMRMHSAWLRALQVKHPLNLAHMRQSSAEHWELIEAIRNGDGDAAASIITRHMGRSRGIVLTHLRRERLQNEASAY